MTKISALTELTTLSGNEWQVIADTGTGTTYKRRVDQGGWVLLATGSARTTTGVTSFSVQPYRTCSELALVCLGIEVTGFGHRPGIKVSVDSGTNFDTGNGNNWEWSQRYTGYNFEGDLNGEDTGGYYFTDNLRNENGCHIDTVTFFPNWQRQGHQKEIYGWGQRPQVGSNDTGNSISTHVVMGARFYNTRDITDIQLNNFDGGEIDTGTYYLYGRS